MNPAWRPSSEPAANGKPQTACRDRSSGRRLRRGLVALFGWRSRNSVRVTLSSGRLPSFQPCLTRWATLSLQPRHRDNRAKTFNSRCPKNIDLKRALRDRRDATTSSPGTPRGTPSTRVNPRARRAAARMANAVDPPGRRGAHVPAVLGVADAGGSGLRTRILRAFDYAVATKPPRADRPGGAQLRGGGGGPRRHRNSRRPHDQRRHARRVPRSGRERARHPRSLTSGDWCQTGSPIATQDTPQGEGGARCPANSDRGQGGSGGSCVLSDGHVKSPCCPGPAG